MSQPQMQRVKTTDGLHLAAYTQGNPAHPAVVLVHGYPDNHHVWDGVADALDNDYYVIRYDVRGAGASEVPKRVRQYRMAQLVQDLDAVTRQVLGERPFYLVGHDWGSIQSWEAATTEPLEGRMLGYLTLSGPSLDHVAYGMREQVRNAPRALINQLKKSWYIAAFQVPVVPELAWHFLNDERWGALLEKLEGFTPDQRAMARNPNQIQDGKNGVNLYRANFTPRLLGPQPRYAHCPVRALVLTDDRFVGRELLEGLDRWVQDFDKEELAATHWAVITHQPEVTDWIQRQVSALQNAHAVPQPAAS